MNSNNLSILSPAMGEATKLPSNNESSNITMSVFQGFFKADICEALTNMHTEEFFSTEATNVVVIPF